MGYIRISRSAFDGSKRLCVNRSPLRGQFLLMRRKKKENLVNMQKTQEMGKLLTVDTRERMHYDHIFLCPAEN